MHIYCNFIIIFVIIIYLFAHLNKIKSYKLSLSFCNYKITLLLNLSVFFTLIRTMIALLSFTLFKDENMVYFHL